MPADGTPPAVDDVVADPCDTTGLLKLVAWMSPSFPVGAFAYSHGLEWAAETGHLPDRAALENWIADLLEHGSIGNDLILLAAAHRAASTLDGDALRCAAELALALQPGAERHLETVTQGNAFVKTVREAWPCAATDVLATAWDEDVALPVAVGVATAGHRIALSATLPAYAAAFVSNLVSAAIRLSVIGQTDGQRIIAGLLSNVQAAAAKALTSTLDDIGSAAWAADIASLRHETQYTRLFRS